MKKFLEPIRFLLAVVVSIPLIIILAIMYYSVDTPKTFKAYAGNKIKKLYKVGS